MIDTPEHANSTERAALQQQVAELERRLAASQAREHLMRQLFDKIPSAIYATSKDGVMTVVNSAFAAQFGQSPSDFEGRALTDMFPPEVAADWQQNIDAAFSDPRDSASQERYGEGEDVRYYESLRFPITDQAGTFVALGGIVSDISNRVRAEAGYADTRRILEGVVNNSPAVIYVKSPENRLMLVNQTYAAVVGRPVDQLVGHSEDEIFPPAVVAAWREHDRNLFASGQPTRSANTFQVNGEPREFITVQFPLYNDGKPYAICGISTDVTDIKRAERERAQLQDDVIQAQQAALRELNTPLIPVAEDVVVMPLIGSIDSARAGQVLETLLEGVGAHRARIAIIDITGLPVVDTQVASALLRAAQAAKLLGAEVLLTGIGPEVAQTLISIGADLGGLKTPGTLQAGIQYALHPSQR